MDISVLLSTSKRNVILEKTLKSFCGLQAEGLKWDIWVVDNANDAPTKNLVGRFTGELPIHYLVEKNAGKNHALNYGLKYTQGSLIALTDDDIIAEKDWLKQLWEGVGRWKKYDIFGGKILPDWPDGKRPFEGVIDNFFCSAFSIADWDIPEGIYAAGKVWGPNMAVRRRIFDQGHRFDPQIGPTAGSYIMGSETEFTKRLEKQGHPSVYLPKATVRHQIRKEQMDRRWLYHRAFRYGRAETYHEVHDRAASFLGAPRFLYRQMFDLALKRIGAALRGSDGEMTNYGVQYWIRKGRIYQHRLNSGVRNETR